jgi:hypothetical protein
MENLDEKLSSAARAGVPSLAYCLYGRHELPGIVPGTGTVVPVQAGGTGTVCRRQCQGERADEQKHICVELNESERKRDEFSVQVRT